jgi:hypothetical protein
MVNSTTFASPPVDSQHVRFHIRESEMGGTSILSSLSSYTAIGGKRPLVELKRRSVVTWSRSARHADEVTAVNILGRRMASTVLLIQALGGGWDRSSLPERPECSGKLVSSTDST